MLVRLIHEVGVIALHAFDKFFLYSFDVEDVVKARGLRFVCRRLAGLDLCKSLESTWRELESTEVWEVQAPPHFIV